MIFLISFAALSESMMAIRHSSQETRWETKDVPRSGEYRTGLVRYQDATSAPCLTVRHGRQIFFPYWQVFASGRAVCGDMVTAVVAEGLSMLNLWAILLPPLAVWKCGRPGQFRINLLLTALLWLPGVIHALWLVSEHC